MIWVFVGGAFSAMAGTILLALGIVHGPGPGVAVGFALLAGGSMTMGVALGGTIA